MNKLQGRSPISIGIVSLITVFSVVMLTSFAVLIITGARTDTHLAGLAADSVSDFYVADGIAEEKRAEIYEIWQGTTPEDLPAALTSLGHEVAQTEEGVTVAYSVVINDAKTLNVSLELPMDTSESMSKLSWKATPTIQ